jgi:methionyl-tRNA synthetase
MLDLKIHDALENIFSLIRTINKYLETKQPWHLIKDDKKVRTDLRYDDVYKTVETMDSFIYNNIEDNGKTPLDKFTYV